MTTQATHTSSLEPSNKPQILFGQIQQLTTEGKNDLEIANVLSIGVGQVRRMAQKNGLRIKRSDAAIVPATAKLLPPMPEQQRAADAVASNKAAAAAVAARTADPEPEVASTPAPEPKKRRGRQPKVQQSITMVDGNTIGSEVTSAELAAIGEITILAMRSGLTPQSFVERCREYVEAWDKITHYTAR